MVNQPSPSATVADGPIDGSIAFWFLLMAICTVFTAIDIRRTSKAVVMKVGSLLTALQPDACPPNARSGARCRRALLCNVMVEQVAVGVARRLVEPITVLAQIDNPAVALVATDDFGQLHPVVIGLRCLGSACRY